MIWAFVAGELICNPVCLFERGFPSSMAVDLLGFVESQCVAIPSAPFRGPIQCRDPVASAPIPELRRLIVNSRAKVCPATLGPELHRCLKIGLGRNVLRNLGFALRRVTRTK